MTERHKLTNEEMAGLDAEYKLLAVKTQTQTQEQAAFLRKEINNDSNLSDARGNRLQQVIDEDGFKLALFRVTEANILSKPTIQVMYDVHDELHAYLTQPESLLPKMLRGFLDGGIDVTGKSKDTAIDTFPLVGKTKAR